jgi:hypothetical protein
MAFNYSAQQSAIFDEFLTPTNSILAIEATARRS